ncbi:MAG TPA: DUF721 domain-containing protein [Acidobacteriota bacterium]|nr:DUF721 domain-containing protein [Acidobacteriota bacterium]
MFPLAELFPLFTERYADIPEVQQGIVRIAWNYCVGEKLRQMSNPYHFQDGILEVRVSVPEWQSALATMKPEIISRINKYLKKEMVRDIRIGLR